MKFPTRLLSNADIEQLLTYDEIVATTEKGWAEYASGRILNPTKESLDLGHKGSWPNYSGFMNAMPAYVGWLDSAGLKWIGSFWDNPKSKLPSLWAIILLIDPRTGEFKAVMEGSLITALRTAAQSIIGIKYLAKKNFQGIGIFGGGLQARYHALMISAMLADKKIQVYDADPLALRAFRDEMLRSKVDITMCQKPRECSEADVVITLTSSKTPFFSVDWLRSGQLVLALGVYQEIYPDTIRKASKLYVDHREQTRKMGALSIIPDTELTKMNVKTIGEVITGKARGREDDDEVLLFEPIGTGLLDVAVATLAYRKAIDKGKGVDFEFVRTPDGSAHS
ncbi:MAG: ornithine cyclodeaminase family protein [Candidatus Bathyarchaeia archaeon]